MKKIAWLLVFACTSLFAQKITLKGTLLDKETNAPVAFANIGFLKIENGTSSTERGTFQFEINPEDLNQKLHISCLNYQDTIVLAKDIQNTTLYLRPQSYELDEIVIAKKKEDRELMVNPIRKKDIALTLDGSLKRPWTVARYFPFKQAYESTPYVKSIQVFLSKYDRRNAKFRIRIFAKDPNADAPKEDLLRESLIVHVEKRNKSVEIDVSKYDIEIPESGFYIALERLHIPYNRYEEEMRFKNKPTEYVMRAAPKFGAVRASDEKMYSYFNGKWFAVKRSFVPAISVTLSN
jgi:hypothetical protein